MGLKRRLNPTGSSDATGRIVGSGRRWEFLSRAAVTLNYSFLRTQKSTVRRTGFISTCSWEMTEAWEFFRFDPIAAVSSRLSGRKRASTKGANRNWLNCRQSSIGELLKLFSCGTRFGFRVFIYHVAKYGSFASGGFFWLAMPHISTAPPVARA